MPSTHTTRHTIVRILTAVLLIMLLISQATYTLRAAQQSFALAAGDQLTITCETSLSGTIQGSKGTVTCAPGTAQLLEGVRGVQEGQALKGSVAIEAVASSRAIAQVVFQIRGPQMLQHTERQRPYFFRGDTNGKPNGWDTRTAPDGEYTLTVTATNRGGQSDTRQIRFRIANGSPPQPTQTQAPQPTQTQAPQPTQTQAPAGATTFRETFDGSPASPQPWRPAHWDVTVHSRDRSSWYQLDTMNAAHGADCAAPPATHTISSYEDAVFVCRDHVMTAIDSAGYAAIILTPNHLVDFSRGEAVVRFDLSTLRTSSRDWVELWITPYEDNLKVPETDAPDLNGPPRNAVRLTMTLNDHGSFNGYLYRNFVEEEVYGGNTASAYEDFLTPSAQRRDTFELRISRTHIAFGMPAYNRWWVNKSVQDLGWDQGIVQLGHYSYSPQKGCDSCGPNTWHWDNVEIQPAVPFTLIRANQRYAEPETPEATLAQPAPAGAHMRFAGIGEQMEVSFDGGATWQKAQPQAQEDFNPASFGTYWMPIPAGTTKVRFRGEDWWGGDWHVRDIAVWSRNR